MLHIVLIVITIMLKIKLHMHTYTTSLYVLTGASYCSYTHVMIIITMYVENEAYTYTMCMGTQTLCLQ